MDPLYIIRAPANTAAPRTPEWMYNEIMRFIEPDLMLESIPFLKLKYAGEDQEEHARRMDWYARAFAQFDKTYAVATHTYAEQAQQTRNRAHAQAMAMEEQERTVSLQKVEKAFDDSSVNQ